MGIVVHDRDTTDVKIPDACANTSDLISAVTEVVSTNLAAECLVVDSKNLGGPDPIPSRLV